MLIRVRVPAVPRRLCSYWALRRLAFFGRRSGRPSLRGPPRVGCFFCTGPRVHPRPAARRRFLPGSPLRLCCPRKGEALPGHWVVLWIRAAVLDPAERVATSPSCRWRRCCLPDKRFLGRSGTAMFRGCAHAARVLVYLRIIREHRCFRSKAHYRLAGLRPGLTGFLPAGRLIGISESPHGSFLSDQPRLVAPFAFAFASHSRAERWRRTPRIRSVRFPRDIQRDR